MKKLVNYLVAIFMCIYLSSQVTAEVDKPMANLVETLPGTVRKLTLSIDQSTESISRDPALTDIVARVPFEKGIGVYVNQPFDLTYYQAGLTFNVKRTHTLSLSAREKKLTGMTVELYPLYEDNFDEALNVLKEWKIRFDEMGLQKIDDHPNLIVRNINTLRKQFDEAKFARYGANAGVWKKDNTYLSVGIDRVEKEYFDTSSNSVARKSFVYKVSITLRDVRVFDALMGSSE